MLLLAIMAAGGFTLISSFYICHTFTIQGFYILHTYTHVYVWLCNFKYLLTRSTITKTYTWLFFLPQLFFPKRTQRKHFPEGFIHDKCFSVIETNVTNEELQLSKGNLIFTCLSSKDFIMIFASSSSYCYCYCLGSLFSLLVKNQCKFQLAKWNEKKPTVLSKRLNKLQFVFL